MQIPINLSISGNWTVAREMRLGFSMPNELKNYTLLDIEVHTVVSYKDKGHMIWLLEKLSSFWGSEKWKRKP